MAEERLGASRGIKEDLSIKRLDSLASPEVREEAERFLYEEARLLDCEQHDVWLKEMVDADVRYIIVSRQLRYRKEKRYDQPAEVYIYDDDYQHLQTRVNQLLSSQYWRADPPERHRRLVTNVEAFETGRDREYGVRSNGLTIRARREYQLDQFVYCREDILRRAPCGSLRLLRRVIDYDERSVWGRNLHLIL